MFPSKSIVIQGQACAVTTPTCEEFNASDAARIGGRQIRRGARDSQANAGGEPMTDISSGPITFEPGDIVQLKSFGPAMTVVAVSGAGVEVLWYGEVDDELKTHVIPAIALEKITVLEEEDDEDEDDDDDDDDDHKGRKHHGKKKHSLA
jgi:uncharacterized protein YodC (DUF2158 family)